MSDFETYPDLASDRLGGAAVVASDEFFAPKERLVLATEPVSIPGRYTERGKWMDGWETRRRREPGHDWVLVRLAAPTRVRGLVVDTRFFSGNFPESCAVDGCFHADHPDPGELLATTEAWVSLLPRSPLFGDTRNRFPVEAAERVNYVRLRIFPDGGVARLRVHGSAIPDPGRLPPDSAVDLADPTLGGRILASSDTHYSPPEHLLLPGPPRGMADGWETRRRRGPGNDWVLLRLATAAVVERLEVDTRWFKGNAPASCSLEGIERGPAADAEPFQDASDWHPLLGRTPLLADAAQRFELEAGGPAVTHLRFQIYPDGGVARLRVIGRPSPGGRERLHLEWLATASRSEAVARFLDCCGARRWAEAMADRRPFADAAALAAAAEAAFRDLGPDDLREAFASHPRLGERQADRPRSATARAWSGSEQAGLEAADAALLDRLAVANRRYEERFGFRFILSASGRSGEEMLAALEQRLANDPETELEVAASEEAAILRLRLEKLLCR